MLLTCFRIRNGPQSREKVEDRTDAFKRQTDMQVIVKVVLERTASSTGSYVEKSGVPPNGRSEMLLQFKCLSARH